MVNEVVFSINDILELNVILVTLLVLLLFLTFSNVSEESFFLILEDFGFSIASVELEARRLSVDRHNSLLVFGVRVLNFGVVLLLVNGGKNRDLMPVVLHHTDDNNERK